LIVPQGANVAQTDVDKSAAVLPDPGQPSTYPRTSDLTQSCSVVMKGGITSGVIYPRAVCQLASTRRLVKVGGTSAGAIAAAAAAAAEYARDAGAGADGSPDVGYPRLAALPNTLTEKTDGHTRLYHLFQPQRATKALYRLVAVWIGSGGKLRKGFGSIIPGLLVQCPLPGLVAGAIAALLVVCAVWFSNWVAVAFAVLLALIATIAAVAWSLKIRVMNDLPTNQFGLCSGMGEPNGTQPALTQWLTDEFDRIANIAADREPLTFGDLESRGITLSMFTTDLSSGTQNELPFRSRVWAFKPAEFAELFPTTVVEWLKECSDKLPSNAAFDQFRANGYYPLPPPLQVPVIVGVRMSLSFPVLLSTVPLHAIDYTTTVPNTNAAASTDPNEHPIVCHRFSDGGITSNFPLTFFDAAVPDRPTFAINLVEVDELSTNPADNVWMPVGNNQGILTTPTQITTTGGFVHALLDTMQNWTDSMQARVPGYRDRIVAVEHTKTEGGMNLDMDPTIISGLAERGQYAGLRTDSFDFTNHRWLRFRSLLQTLEEFIAPAEVGLQGPGPNDGPSYDQMINDRPPAPPSYRSPWGPTVSAAFTDVKAAIVGLGATYGSANGGRDPDQPSIVTEGAPSPHPRLQVRPKPLS
jgi:hypothetical protein